MSNIRLSDTVLQCRSTHHRHRLQQQVDPKPGTRLAILTFQPIDFLRAKDMKLLNINPPLQENLKNYLQRINSRSHKILKLLALNHHV
jgi:hypothetical protein